MLTYENAKWCSHFGKQLGSFFFFFLPHHAACGTSLTKDRTRGPLQCKPGVLTTGPPGKSNYLAVSYQDKRTLSTHPYNSTPQYLPKPRKMKTYIHTKGGFVLKNWKQTKCPSTGG